MRALLLDRAYRQILSKLEADPAENKLSLLDHFLDKVATPWVYQFLSFSSFCFLCIMGG